MGKTVAENPRITANSVLLTLHAPAGFQKGLGKLPPGVILTKDSLGPADGYQQIHWFVTSQARLQKEVSMVLKKLRPWMTVWINYPKGSSGIQTNLSRDKGRPNIGKNLVNR